jgi:hypothetical protein
LDVLNAAGPFKEELCGLSRKAIERWTVVNGIKDGGLPRLLLQISSKLFLLSAKSQEQVTNDYRLISDEVDALIAQLSTQLNIEGLTK